MSDAVAGVTVRDATADDLPAITTIYNDVLRTSAAIWRDEPVSLADRATWFRAQQERGHPVLVAVGADGDVLGFASLGDFRPWPGYHPTVEHSIHVAEAHRGEGVGRRLMAAVIERAATMGKEVLVAGVDAGNTASIRFHERLGFVEVGRMPGIGRKFGEPVDLVLLQRGLSSDDGR